MRLAVLSILCVVAMMLVMTFPESSSGVFVRKRSNLNNNIKINKLTKNDIPVANKGFPLTINNVSPDLVPLNAPTNLTVSYNGFFSTCFNCVFNVAFNKNVTVEGTVYFSTVVCPFPSSDVNKNTVVAVWLQECDSESYSTPYSIYAYAVAPTIVQVSPSNLYGTGGVNATVVLKNYFDFQNTPFRKMLSSSFSSYWSLTGSLFLRTNDLLHLLRVPRAVLWLPHK